jgi:hypothetical protein
MSLFGECGSANPVVDFNSQCAKKITFLDGVRAKIVTNVAFVAPLFWRDTQNDNPSREHGNGSILK